MKLKVKNTKTVVILLLSAMLLNCKNSSSNNILEKNNEQIEDIIKKNIVGKWVLKKENNQLFLYENNTWKMIFTDYNDDTLIKKGKYTIAKDSAVFFRYFGALHWPNTDTINDYKTSLGAFVLFLNEKEQLNDNQEDYEQSYVKVN